MPRIRVYATFQTTIARDVEAKDNSEAIDLVSAEIDQMTDAQILEAGGELSLDDYETEIIEDAEVPA